MYVHIKKRESREEKSEWLMMWKVYVLSVPIKLKISKSEEKLEGIDWVCRSVKANPVFSVSCDMRTVFKL